MTMVGSRSVEGVRLLRLRVLYRDEVLREGQMKAAEVVAVNQKTVARALSLATGPQRRPRRRLGLSGGQ